MAMVIVPMLLGALALLASQALQDEERSTDQLTTLAGTLVEAVDRELDKGKAQLDVLAAGPALDKGDVAALYEYATKVAAARGGSLIALVRPDGQQLFNTATAYGSPQPNLWQLAESHQEVVWEGRRLPLSSQNLTRQVFDTAAPVYSDLYYGFSVRRPTLSLSVPVIRGGKVAYAMTLAFPPALLEDLIRARAATGGLRIVVVDRRGFVVASNGTAASRLGDMVRPITIPPGSMAGTYELVSRDGTLVRGGYAVSGKNGFVVRVSVPKAALLLSVGRGTTAGWLLLVAVSLATSLVFARLLGRRISVPLQRLARASTEGRPPESAAPTGIAEIDALAESLKLAAQAEQERSAALVVSAQRAEAEQALRRADRQKDEFLATLAHELRNPLAPIRTSVEIIRRRSGADEVVRHAQEVIARQLAHLTRLVDDLLDVSRITLGTVQLRRERVDLRTVAAEAVEAVSGSLPRAGLELDYLASDQPVMVEGDSTRLAQCLVNLLANAIKFSPSGGKIVLRVDAAAGHAIVEVRDNGMGIAPEALDRIFELFVQEHISGSQGNTGLGVGLALTRKLLALHGGSIRAESAGPGQGAAFLVELPLVQAHPLAAAASSRPAAVDRPVLRVLVVDDNEDAAASLAALLDMSGFECTLAHTGEAAVSAAAAGAFDAIVLDIGLPGIDGYEACRRIRAQLQPPPVLVALTGWGQEQDRRSAEDAGFDAHLTKPADPLRVIDLLQALALARGRDVSPAEGSVATPGAAA